MNTLGSVTIKTIKTNFYIPLQWPNNNCSCTVLCRSRDYPFTSLLALEHIQLVLLLTPSCNFFFLCNLMNLMYSLYKDSFMLAHPMIVFLTTSFFLTDQHRELENYSPSHQQTL